MSLPHSNPALNNYANEFEPMETVPILFDPIPFYILAFQW